MYFYNTSKILTGNVSLQAADRKRTVQGQLMRRTESRVQQ